MASNLHLDNEQIHMELDPHDFPVAEEEVKLSKEEETEIARASQLGLDFMTHAIEKGKAMLLKAASEPPLSSLKETEGVEEPEASKPKTLKYKFDEQFCKSCWLAKLCGHIQKRLKSTAEAAGFSENFAVDYLSLIESKLTRWTFKIKKDVNLVIGIESEGDSKMWTISVCIEDFRSNVRDADMMEWTLKAEVDSFVKANKSHGYTSKKITRRGTRVGEATVWGFNVFTARERAKMTEEYGDGVRTRSNAFGIWGGAPLTWLMEGSVATYAVDVAVSIVGIIESDVALPFHDALALLGTGDLVPLPVSEKVTEQVMLFQENGKLLPNFCVGAITMFVFLNGKLCHVDQGSFISNTSDAEGTEILKNGNYPKVNEYYRAGLGLVTKFVTSLGLGKMSNIQPALAKVLGASMQRLMPERQRRRIQSDDYVGAFEVSSAVLDLNYALEGVKTVEMILDGAGELTAKPGEDKECALKLIEGKTRELKMTLSPKHLSDWGANITQEVFNQGGTELDVLSVCCYANLLKLMHNVDPSKITEIVKTGDDGRALQTWFSEAIVEEQYGMTLRMLISSSRTTDSREEDDCAVVRIIKSKKMTADEVVVEQVKAIFHRLGGATMLKADQTNVVVSAVNQLTQEYKEGKVLREAAEMLRKAPGARVWSAWDVYEVLKYHETYDDRLKADRYTAHGPVHGVIGISRLMSGAHGEMFKGPILLSIDGNEAKKGDQENFEKCLPRFEKHSAVKARVMFHIPSDEKPASGGISALESIANEFMIGGGLGAEECMSSLRSGAKQIRDAAVLWADRVKRESDVNVEVVNVIDTNQVLRDGERTIIIGAEQLGFPQLAVYIQRLSLTAMIATTKAAIETAHISRMREETSQCLMAYMRMKILASINSLLLDPVIKMGNAGSVCVENLSKWTELVRTEDRLKQFSDAMADAITSVKSVSKADEYVTEPVNIIVMTPNAAGPSSGTNELYFATEEKNAGERPEGRVVSPATDTIEIEVEGVIGTVQSAMKSMFSRAGVVPATIEAVSHEIEKMNYGMISSFWYRVGSSDDEIRENIINTLRPSRHYHGKVYKKVTEMGEYKIMSGSIVRPFASVTFELPVEVEEYGLKSVPRDELRKCLVIFPMAGDGSVGVCGTLQEEVTTDHSKLFKA
jgi:hypothetical protein